MEELTFMTTTGDKLNFKCNSNEKMEIICKKFALKINKNYNHLIFFSNGLKIDKQLTARELKQKNAQKKNFVILVKIMEMSVEDDPEEEKASEDLKKKIIDEIKNPLKNSTYEEMQELAVQYGYHNLKNIEKEMEENPNNYMNVKEAIEKKDSNKNYFILGKLGQSLENIGIKTIINKKPKKDEEYIINNQLISSGILQEKKYEFHIQENDPDKLYEIFYNKDSQNKFKEEWKEIISNNINIPKKDIFISNIRNGSIKMDVILKNKKIERFLEKMEKLSNHQKIKEIKEKNILEALILSEEMLDSRGDRQPNEWAKPPVKRGRIDYFPPDKNWIGFGLRVLDQYDNGNNDWIQMNNNKNEWAVAYHGTSNSAIKPICSKNGKFFASRSEGGERQYYENYKNVNKFSNAQYPKCGEGAYCSPSLNVAEGYSEQKSGDFVIMCRVNPKKLRIPEGIAGKKNWLVDGTRNSIRPYRVICRLNLDNKNKLMKDNVINMQIS